MKIWSRASAQQAQLVGVWAPMSQHCYFHQPSNHIGGSDMTYSKMLVAVLVLRKNAVLVQCQDSLAP